MKKILIVGALLAACSAASAQSPIIQSGSVTPGHAWKVITNGVAGDAGTAANGSLTSLGVTASGPALCQNSGPVTGPYNQLCFSPTGTGGGFSWFNYGGATGTPTFNINGTLYPFFGSGTGNVLGPSTTTPGCAAPWANTTGTLLGNNCAISLSGTVVTTDNLTSTFAPGISGGYLGTTLDSAWLGNWTAAQAAVPEVGAMFSMQSSVGANANPALYFKAALGWQTILSFGSASGWGATGACTLNSGAGTSSQIGCNTLELDLNVKNAAYSTVGLPNAFNLFLSGGVDSSSHYGQGAICVCYAGANPLWNYGIVFYDNAAQQTKLAAIYDDDHSPTTLLDVGTHTNGIDFSGATDSGLFIKGPGSKFTVSDGGSISAYGPQRFNTATNTYLVEIGSLGSGIQGVTFNGVLDPGTGSAIYTGGNPDLYINVPSTNTLHLRVAGTDVATLTASGFSTPGQLTSTIATGTAPFAVSSTTNVANLNASSLNGATFAAPGAIGAGTAAAGTFTSITAGYVLASGAGAGLEFDTRSTGHNWLWYSNAGTATLFDASAGSGLLTVAQTTGNTAISGTLTVVGITTDSGAGGTFVCAKNGLLYLATTGVCT